MGALTIAFDITIAGALALPWVLLIVRLYFPEAWSRIPALLRFIRKCNQPAAFAVLLFTVAYLIGSGVSRTAQDFLNDDDLNIHLDGQLFRMAATEDRIRTSVYCNSEDLLQPGTKNPSLVAAIDRFRCLSEEQKRACRQSLRWHVSVKAGEQAEEINQPARDIFGYQENTLMLRGEDATGRLRQLHDQYMVLRSAAFNGLIAFSMCLFACGAKLFARKPSRLRWIALLIPAVYFLVASVSMANHLAERESREPHEPAANANAQSSPSASVAKQNPEPSCELMASESSSYEEREPSDPPFMEFVLFVLAGAGLLLIVRGPQPPESCRKWAVFAALTALLTVGAILAWWSTEVVYSQQVIYAFDSQEAVSPK
jgi:hypothetical protein